MKNLNITVEYIYHSGFTIETKDHFLIFDYYKGDIQLKNKDTYVFVSHGHDDHFNPDILNWDINHKLEYIFSNDIEDIYEDHIHYMSPYKELIIDDINIKSFGSTDLGLSFLVRLDGLSIFFAGDLNWWYWKDDTLEEKMSMEKDFKEEINRLLAEKIDIAFFPVDPRLEEYYYLGGEYFINKIKPKFFFPMHFGDNYSRKEEFIHKCNTARTTIVDIKEKNQIFKI